MFYLVGFKVNIKVMYNGRKKLEGKLNEGGLYDENFLVLLVLKDGGRLE